MLKVAIANDSAIAIEALRRALLNDSGYELLWVAQTGIEAIKHCAQNCPDLLLMDMHMPNCNGVEATRQIMQQSPCMILIVTASINRHSSMVFKAMSYGALDVVRTPSLGTTQAVQGLLKKMALLAKHPSTYTPTFLNSPTPKPPSTNAGPSLPNLIVIGASTGGPGALQTILSQFPKDFNAAVVIVQHIDDPFVPNLISWLNQTSTLPVAQAKNGDFPKAGRILVAGGNQHIVMRPNHRLRHTREPITHPYRPSVDVFFQSVAIHWQQPGIAVLLTGMGKDGAKGLEQLQSAKWHTVAESAASCVVFGMPKAAIERGAAKQILSLNQITHYLVGNI